MSNFSYSESMKDIGLKGNLNDVTRIQKITMFDNYFEPASLNVKEGETILFKIVNSGNSRIECLRIAQTFRAHTIDSTQNSFIFYPVMISCFIN